MQSIVNAVSVVGVVLSVGALPLVAQGDPDHEWCDEGRRGDSEVERYCEVRDLLVDARDLVRVDGGPNGGIHVEAWDRNEIRVLARVQIWSRRDDPEAFTDEITIETDRVIRATGPRNGRDRMGWAVSYRLHVPHETGLSLETVNGGIDVAGVRGDIEFTAVNGGIHLEGVGGDVRGRTTNGGIFVDLDGERWSGSGLDVETTNGGVTLVVPEGFAADLETGTINGGFQIDFPVTVSGRINRRRIRTELNGGGPPVRAVTTNGGVTVRRK